jgi:hypothetical protein
MLPFVNFMVMSSSNTDVYTYPNGISHSFVTRISTVCTQNQLLDLILSNLNAVYVLILWRSVLILSLDILQHKICRHFYFPCLFYVLLYFVSRIISNNNNCNNLHLRNFLSSFITFLISSPPTSHHYLFSHALHLR